MICARREISFGTGSWLSRASMFSDCQHGASSAMLHPPRSIRLQLLPHRKFTRPRRRSLHQSYCWMSLHRRYFLKESRHYLMLAPSCWRPLQQNNDLLSSSSLVGRHGFRRCVRRPDRPSCQNSFHAPYYGIAKGGIHSYFNSSKTPWKHSRV